MRRAPPGAAGRQESRIHTPLADGAACDPRLLSARAARSAACRSRLCGLRSFAIFAMTLRASAPYGLATQLHGARSAAEAPTSSMRFRLSRAMGDHARRLALRLLDGSHGQGPTFDRILSIG